MNKSIYLII